MENILGLDDIQSIVRILGELLEPTGRTPNELRADLMNQIAALCNASGWVWSLSKLNANRVPSFYFKLSGGFTEERVRSLLELDGDPKSQEVIHHPIRDRVARENVTISRGDYVSEESWAAVSDRYEAVGVCDYLWSLYHVGDGLISGVSLVHDTPGRRFSVRDKAIMQLIMSEIDWLHRHNADVPGAHRVAGLTVRQRSVLMRALAGEAVKEMGVALGLSPYTVADHMKAIFSHYGIKSRAELLALFINGNAVKSVQLQTRLTPAMATATTL